jgi:hypothetical protein
MVDLSSMVPPNKLGFVPQKNCTFDVINSYGFNLLILTNIGLGSKLINVTNKTILLSNTLYPIQSKPFFGELPQM